MWQNIYHLSDLPRGPIKNNSMRRLAATTLLDILPPKIADRYIALEEICKLKMNYLFWKFFEHDTSCAKTSSNGVQLNWIFSGWIRRWRRILTALTTSWHWLAWSLTTDLGRRTNFGNDYLLPFLLYLSHSIFILFPRFTVGPPWLIASYIFCTETRNLWRRHFVT